METGVPKNLAMYAALTRDGLEKPLSTVFTAGMLKAPKTEI